VRGMPANQQVRGMPILEAPLRGKAKHCGQPSVMCNSPAQANLEG
jgi:hypothetical protein